ncbi:hypothetical protein C8R47DRAFT_808024 [Mycena vitilis]|nr:hypothetical protein C8R47DRAFT_808024 [Mycena vitilis]
MSLPRPLLLTLLVVSLLPGTLAQDSDDGSGGTPQIEGTGTSKVAITGAIIGGLLLIIALGAIAIYGIDRWRSRRRAKTAPFAPLPIRSDDGEYRYLALPPRTSTLPTKSEGDIYDHGPFYPGAGATRSISATSLVTTQNSRQYSSVPSNSSTRYGGSPTVSSPSASTLRFSVDAPSMSPPSSPNPRRYSGAPSRSSTSTRYSAAPPGLSPTASTLRFEPYTGPIHSDSVSQPAAPSPRYPPRPAPNPTPSFRSAQSYTRGTPSPPVSLRNDQGRARSGSILSGATSSTLSQ